MAEKLAKKMTKDQTFFVATRLENMEIPPYRKYKCSECESAVGITKASYGAFKQQKKVIIICFECFKKRKDPKAVIERPTVEQIKEMRTIKPDLDEMDIRNMIDNLKTMIKGKTLK